MFTLKDKTAVVSGAGRGIGQAIALTFAKAGAKVAVVSRTEVNAGKAAEEINSLHPGAAKAYAADVSDGGAVADLGKRVLADFGTVDILSTRAARSGSRKGTPPPKPEP